MPTLRPGALVFLLVMSTAAQAWQVQAMPSQAPAPATEPEPTQAADASADAPVRDTPTAPPLVGSAAQGGAPGAAGEVRRKDAGGRVWLGLLIGGAVGAGAGYLGGASGLFGACGGPPGTDNYCSYAGTITGAVGLGLGGLLGAIYGLGLDAAAKKAASTPKPAKAAGSAPVRSGVDTAAGVRLVPAVGVSAQGAFGGVVGSF